LVTETINEGILCLYCECVCAKYYHIIDAEMILFIYYYLFMPAANLLNSQRIEQETQLGSMTYNCCFLLCIL